MTPSELLTNDMLSMQGLFFLGFPIFLLGVGVVELVRRHRKR